MTGVFPNAPVSLHSSHPAGGAHCSPGLQSQLYEQSTSKQVPSESLQSSLPSSVWLGLRSLAQREYCRKQLGSCCSTGALFGAVSSLELPPLLILEDNTTLGGAFCSWGCAFAVSRFQPLAMDTDAIESLWKPSHHPQTRQKPVIKELGPLVSRWPRSRLGRRAAWSRQRTLYASLGPVLLQCFTSSHLQRYVLLTSASRSRNHTGLHGVIKLADAPLTVAVS